MGSTQSSNGSHVGQVQVELVDASCEGIQFPVDRFVARGSR